MPTGYQVGLQDLTGSKHQIVHAYDVLGRCCTISGVQNNRYNRLTRYKDGTAVSHGLGTSDRTCLRAIRVGLHDLTDKEQQFQQFQHAYKVSGRGCMISRVRNIRSNMPTRYQVGAAGSHGLGAKDRTRSNNNNNNNNTGS